MRPLLPLVCALALAAPSLASAQAAAGLRSESKLMEDAGATDSWSYRNPNINLSRYKAFVIEPTQIYSGPTTSWGGVAIANRQKYAAAFTEALRKEIGGAYEVTSRKGPGVGSLRLTLLGVQPTNTVGAAASMISPVGLAMTGVRSLTGKKGTYTGSVALAIELTDSQTGELQAGAVRRRSPAALDIEASASTEKTVEAVAQHVAGEIREALDRANGR